MNCTECEEFINAYLDGELGERLRAELASHLACCPDCCSELASWEACIDWLRKSFPEQVPPLELWQKICARTETE